MHAYSRDADVFCEGGEGEKTKLTNWRLKGKNMDISILLALQEFRNGVGACLTDFMTKMSFIGEMNTVLIIMGLIYWCVSKKFGKYLLMGWSGNRVVNGLLKVAVCVYRPWIRDARIVPDSAALASATGYSFPSGHSMNAASLYGGGAIRKEFSKALRVTLGIVVALIALSRNFLGVHTPQDILVGVCAGLLVMWLTGKLLVDGAKMANDTYKGVGWCIGFLTGWVLERRYIGFSTDVPMMTRVTRLTLGLLGYYAVSLILLPLIKRWIPGAGGTILSCYVQMFYVVFLFPLCMKRLERVSAR